jgi:hypothetical protein
MKQDNYQTTLESKIKTLETEIDGYKHRSSQQVCSYITQMMGASMNFPQT